VAWWTPLSEVVPLPMMSNMGGGLNKVDIPAKERARLAPPLKQSTIENKIRINLYLSKTMDEKKPLKLAAISHLCAGCQTRLPHEVTAWTE
jgi:hypothetical protein